MPRTIRSSASGMSTTNFLGAVGDPPGQERGGAAPTPRTIAAEAADQQRQPNTIATPSPDTTPTDEGDQEIVADLERPAAARQALPQEVDVGQRALDQAVERGDRAVLPVAPQAFGRLVLAGRAAARAAPPAAARAGRRRRRSSCWNSANHSTLIRPTTSRLPPNTTADRRFGSRAICCQSAFMSSSPAGAPVPGRSRRPAWRSADARRST